MMVYLLFVICGLLYLFFYINGRRWQKYWKQRGINYYQKNKNFGLFWDLVMKPKRANFECISELYNAHKGEPAVGFGCFLIPGILVTDPVNCQHVMENDFKSFFHRGPTTNELDFLGTSSISLSNGVEWKLKRRAYTGLFTISKINQMFHSIDEVAKEFLDYMKQNDNSYESTYKCIRRYCSATVLADVFGIKCESTFETPFISQVQIGVPSTYSNYFKVATAISAPFITKVLNQKFFGEVEEFYMSFLRQIVNRGGDSNFANYYKTKLKDTIVKDDASDFELKLSDEIAAANMLFFINANMEGGTTAIFTTLLLLAQHTDIQEKLRQEVDKAYEKCNGKLTSDVINDISYLEMVLNETLRIYPPLPFITRKCTQNTVLPVGNINVDEGTLMVIPSYQHHHDPKYFENPEVFDPERFADPKLANASIYKPFGRGPRMCLAYKYAKLEAKTLLFHMLQRYKVKLLPGQEKAKFTRNIFFIDLSEMSLDFVPRA